MLMKNAAFKFSIAHKQEYRSVLIARFKLIDKMKIYESKKLVQIVRNPEDSKALINELVRFAKSDMILCLFQEGLCIQHDRLFYEFHNITRR